MAGGERMAETSDPFGIVQLKDAMLTLGRELKSGLVQVLMRLIVTVAATVLAVVVGATCVVIGLSYLASAAYALLRSWLGGPWQADLAMGIVLVAIPLAALLVIRFSRSR
jgi:hypothetical protein